MFGQNLNIYSPPKTCAASIESRTTLLACELEGTEFGGS